LARALLTGAAAAIIASCATVSPPAGELSKKEKRALYEAHAAALESLDRWVLDGKLAVSDGEDGGTGRLEWRAQADINELDFRGALGRGSWQLDITPQRSVLSLGNGEVWEAPEVSSLVQRHVGWHVPVDALGWWVRGLAAPGKVDGQEIDNDGRLTRLSQHGWNVEYDRYREFSGMALPTRVDARSGARRVKFVMREWTFPERPENDT
jgi:outer membrane lipoprotein LolB